MNATIIHGYGVESKKLDREITKKTTAFLKSHRRPLQFGSSSPFIELLGGAMDWAAVEACVKKQKGSFPAFDDENALGLVIPDLAHPELGAVAFPLHDEGDVTPAVTLKVSGAVWVAEACVFETGLLASSMIANFNSASVAALLDLTLDAFAKTLIAPHKAGARLRYIRDVNDEYMPCQPEKRRWTIASHWPDWRRRRLGLPACNVELGVLENNNSLGDEAFRQIASRMKLQISDRTDGVAVTKR